jgi:hypothetical protein
MAWLDKNPTRRDGTSAFEAVMGSVEILLYEIDYTLITKIDFANNIFWGIIKNTLPQKLNVSQETLIDSLLMTGTSFLPPFPVLKDREVIKQQPYTLTDAINMFRTAHKSITTLCQTWIEVLQKQEPQWEDKYRKAKMALKHNIHVADRDPTSPESVARVMVTDYDQLTQDHHEYIGLQLPAELYHYLIHGSIGQRVMNWLSYLELLVFPPLGGGDSEEYRRLVTQQLIPIQAQSIALYTSRMHRVYQHKNFTTRFWFDNTTTVSLNHQNVDPAPDKLAATWRINQDVYEKHVTKSVVNPGSFLFALDSLEEAEFVALTTKEVKVVGNLKSHAEILSNIMWRLLHLRGYINNDHQPTVWGKALIAALTQLSSSGVRLTNEVEEAAFLAFELLRLNQLNVHNRHEEWVGAPQRGTNEDKNHCLLIARCACLIKLRHKEEGYTGPLSKNLLAFYSIISAVREADRDLVEAITASMFMFAQADRVNARDDKSTEIRKRNNDDWIELGFRYVYASIPKEPLLILCSLPFGKDVDIGLGIAVKTYLDDYARAGTTKEEKKTAKESYVTQQLPKSVDFAGDLEIAFNFFDAIHRGVKTLGSEIPANDLAIWEGAGKYLAEKR